MARAAKRSRKKPAARRGTFYSRRCVLLGGIQAAAFGVLGVRLFDLQVLDAEKYALLAEENRINLRPITPLRGKIVDRFGHVLASNRDNLQLIVVPEKAGDIEAILARLNRHVPLDARDRRRVLRRARRQRGFVPITVKEDLSWGEFARVNVQGPELPGVVPQIGALRYYHFARDMAHVLGYVGHPSEDEAFDDPTVLLPGLRVGKNGIEQAFDAKLRGSAGARRVEVNAGGRVIRELERQDGVPGAELVTTVDLEIQRFAMQRIEGESAAIVAMDIHNGDILALASAPGFDANEFVNGIAGDTWRALNADPRKPLHNKALNGIYPPGSVFKMVVALAGLKHGVITRKTRMSCSGGYRLGGRTFRCWKRGGHGAVRLHKAIKMSCDSYFYEVARRLGVDRIAEMANRLGLGLTGFGLPGARAGHIPTTGWKRAVLGEKWYGGDTIVAGIGQGYVSASPLELAVMTARIANGDNQVEPRLVRALGGSDLPVKRFAPLGIDPQDLKLVRAGMNAVVNHGGTAARSRISYKGQKMAGKTGTSQVRRMTAADRRRRKRDIPWELRDHALFVAYAPVKAPRYAVCVVVEHGGGGSRAAAPVAKDVMMQLLERDPLSEPPFRSNEPVDQAARAIKTTTRKRGG